MQRKRIINNSRQFEKRKILRKNSTKEELIIWNLVRNNAFGVRFKRQVSIGPYVADFYCSAKKLILEIDGSQHLKNKDYDNERDRYFLSLGVTTLRFWNNEVNSNLDGIYMKINQFINS